MRASVAYSRLLAAAKSGIRLSMIDAEKPLK
jgi:hypothetical protein